MKIELAETEIRLIDKLLTNETAKLIRMEKATAHDHVKRVLNIKQKEVALLRIKLGTFAPKGD